MIHMELVYIFQKFELFKNTNFEELQNLFDITQKLTSLSSGQRQKHWFIQIPFFAWKRLSELADAGRRWEGQVEEFEPTFFLTDI